MILKIGRARSVGTIGGYTWTLFDNEEYIENGVVTLTEEEKIASKSVLDRLEPMLEGYGLDTDNVTIQSYGDPYVLKYEFED